MELDQQRYLGERSSFEDKIRTLEGLLQVKTLDFESAQTEIRELRDANSRFEIQIQTLMTQLNDSSMYKEWYETKSKEYDDLQVQLSEEQRKLFEKDDEIMSLSDQLTTKTSTIDEL